jgi:WD40 repeat protein
VLQPWTRRFISTGEVTSLRFSRDGKNVLVSSEDHTARLWDAATGRELIPPLWHSNEVNAAAFNPDETRIATAGSDNSVVLWNAATGQRLASRLLADGAMWMVEFDPVGQRLLTGSRGGTVRVWDAALTKEACVIQHEGRLASAHFSPDGSQILTASGDRTARLWDAQTGKPAFDPVRHRSASVNAVFTPDGHRFVTAGQEGTVQVFDRMTGKRCYEPIIYPAPVREGTPEFHPSGKSAATAAGSAVFVWDVNTGAPLLPPLTHREVVLAVKFSADGALLATASQDKTARIWEVATGLPVSEPLPHTSKVVCLAFSPDGRWLATGTAGGSVHMWEAPRLGESPPPWMADLAEALVGQRLDESNQAGAVSVDRLGALREALLQSAANDECTRWAKWLFADGRSRPVSFGASLDLRSYVDSLLRADRLDPLRDAVFLAPTNALAHARLARALLQQSPQEPRPLLAADWNSRYAMNLAPDDSEVRQIREVVIDKLRNAGIGPTVPANEK